MRPVAKKVGAWQSPMKITKRLIASIIMLALSVAFCVWAVFAWFSQNSRVDATGMQVSVQGNELYMTVYVYRLGYFTQNNVTVDSKYVQVSEEPIAVISNKDGISMVSGEMPSYLGQGSMNCSAVLVQIEVEATQNYSGGDVPVAITFGNNFSVKPEYDTNNNIIGFNSNLSDVISVYPSSQETEGVYVISGNQLSFTSVENSSTSKTNIVLQDIAVAAGAKAQNYYIMDYSDSLMTYIYGLTSGFGGVVSAEITFDNDLIFVLNDSTIQGPEAHVHEWSAWTQTDTWHSRTCTLCNTTETANHTWSAWTQTADGHSRTCYICSYSAGEVAHEFVYSDNGDGTHTGACSVCGLTFRAEHAYGEWSAVQNGQRTRTCETCNHTQTQTIVKTSYVRFDSNINGQENIQEITDNTTGITINFGGNSNGVGNSATFIGENGTISFNYAYLPTGNGRELAVTATSNSIVTLYYRLTDSSFSSTNNAGLEWRFNTGKEGGSTNGNVDCLAGTVLAVTIELIEDETVTFTVTGGNRRIALYGYDVLNIE